MINIYLDGVLFPNVLKNKQIFEQEGWHYEISDPSDPLKLSGVVYNEMKGVYSSPDSILSRSSQKYLFPNNCYFHDSGGDPKDIPRLSYEELKLFHSKYYHPSNSKVFFYGNDDPIKRLEILDEYFNRFDQIKVDSKIIPQKLERQLLPKKSIYYPISDESEPRRMLTVNWVLMDNKPSPKLTLSLAILDYLLIGTSSSKLRHDLINSSLGESLIGGGLSDELLQPTFSIGLRGIPEDCPDQVEKIILESLKNISKDGFSKNEINA